MKRTGRMRIVLCARDGGSYNAGGSAQRIALIEWMIKIAISANLAAFA